MLLFFSLKLGKIIDRNKNKVYKKGHYEETIFSFIVSNF